MENRTASDGEQYSPPGKLVDIGGYCLHILSSGQGEPTVVMESAIWDVCLSWSLVQPAVSSFAQAVTYDRAGLGWSDPTGSPRHGAQMVAELHLLLQACELPGPYILVGHSFSGLLARLFASRFPQDVAGIVLLDPAHEDQNQRYPQPIQDMFAPLKQAQIEQLRGVKDVIASQGPDAAPPLLPAPHGFPADIYGQYLWLSRRDPSRIDTMIGELEQLETTQAQVRLSRVDGKWYFPLVVLSHGVPQTLPGMPDEVNQAYESAWQEMQVEIAGLSDRGRRVAAENSGHMIHHEQPELVVEAIRQVVEEVRGSGR